MNCILVALILSCDKNIIDITINKENESDSSLMSVSPVSFYSVLENARPAFALKVLDVERKVGRYTYANILMSKSKPLYYNTYKIQYQGIFSLTEKRLYLPPHEYDFCTVGVNNICASIPPFTEK